MPVIPSRKEASEAFARKMQKDVITRAADMIFLFCAGEHATVVKWFVSLGCKLVCESPGQWTLDGIAGVRSALCTNLGPLDQVPVFGFLLAGVFWPQVYGGLGAEVDRRLRELKHPPRER